VRINGVIVERGRRAKVNVGIDETGDEEAPAAINAPRVGTGH
jgi:hypothetical protein